MRQFTGAQLVTDWVTVNSRWTRQSRHSLNETIREGASNNSGVVEARIIFIVCYWLYF